MTTCKETMVTRYNVYLPSVKQENRTIETIGERRFFENKFWKVVVMLGFDWNNSILVSKGFSMINRKTTYSDRIFDFLNTNRIEYKVTATNYICHINISRNKENLKLIDTLYETYGEEQIHKGSKLGLVYDGNYLVNDEMITIGEWQSENKRIQKL